MKIIRFHGTTEAPLGHTATDVIARPLVVMIDDCLDVLDLYAMANMNVTKASRGLNGNPTTRDIPVLVLTGDESATIERRASDDGVIYVPRKPCPADRPLRALHDVVRQREIRVKHETASVTGAEP